MSDVCKNHQHNLLFIIIIINKNKQSYLKFIQSIALKWEVRKSGLLGSFAHIGYFIACS